MDRPESHWLARLPAAMRATLTPEQTAAIADAVAAAGRRPYLVDLRITLPLPRYPAFVTLVGGRERRAPDRRRLERARHPIVTAGNVVFLIMALAGFYAMALAITLLSSSILEF